MTIFEFEQISRALRAFASSLESGINNYGLTMGWTPTTLRKLAHKLEELSPKQVEKIVKMFPSIFND